MAHLLFLIPLLPFIGFIAWTLWMVRQSSRGRSPLTSKLLRPPGHSLALKLEVTQERFFIRMALAAALAGGSGALASIPGSWSIIALLAVALVELGLLIHLRFLLIQVRAQRRGLLGEQAVGETLAVLQAKGCHVFHDLVHENGEGSFNIDHIIVGPQGVFAVETKYRQKPTAKGGTDWKVEARAHTLHFPTGVDHASIPQAERQAQWLAGFLRKATAEPVKVHPILTLPGWWINVRERNGVPVLNEKQIAGFVLQSPRILRDEQVQRIAHQLEQRCRDVEV